MGRTTDPLRKKLVVRYNAALRRIQDNPQDMAAKDEALSLRRMLQRHDRAKKESPDA
jgi:hypothetical protein